MVHPPLYALALLDKDDQVTAHALDDLCHDDAGGGDVHGIHFPCPGVAHHKHKQCILQSETHQTHILHGVALRN